ncbi:MAG TPA: MFS transporter, partial [Beijerinckiaceae bacterium]|nr:MFS transporter [Beijerinckiaceae bacterium]
MVRHERATDHGTAYAVLIAISVSHLLNDVIQSLLPAIYPILKETYRLDFGQIGLLTLTFQATASLLQPVVGLQTDRRPTAYSLPVGMGVSLIGLLLLANTSSFGMLLLAAALVGMGSAIFHPEASRVARLGSGGRHGFAQSVFQVGGSSGSALGPLLAAFIVVPRGQSSIAWFSIVALVAMIILWNVGRWYRRRLSEGPRKPPRAAHEAAAAPARAKVLLALGILVALIFSKNFYTASINSYYTFYLINKFDLPVQTAQIFLFLFLGSVAAGTLFGGPIGDRFGRKYVIWFSVLGVLPFTLALPYVDLFWTGVLTVIIGLILASSFPAIIVYAQELVPRRTGMISGLFFGLGFGMGGLGAAVLGQLADATSITVVYQVCSFLPAIGLLAAFLPDVRAKRTV